MSAKADQAGLLLHGLAIAGQHGVAVHHFPGLQAQRQSAIVGLAGGAQVGAAAIQHDLARQATGLGRAIFPRGRGWQTTETGGFILGDRDPDGDPMGRKTGRRRREKAGPSWP